MYRDAAFALDEHDRAVGAILIGESLMVQCERSADRIRDPHDSERWRAMREIQDDYPEIWRQLDRAREVLATRGANTMAYEEMRPHVRRTLAVENEDHTQSVDAEALEDARRAIAELKLAVPGADWKAIAARTAGLVELPLRSRRVNHRWIVGSVATMFVLTLAAWLIAIIPEHKPTRHETMRRELAGITHERKSRIDFLHAELGDRCLTAPAHDLVRLMVLDGRTSDAKEFGAAYIARCGADEVVEDWAKAPRPGH
jgi:hypothetical protein